MKFLIVGDVHFSQYSSILRRRGEVYSSRLENLVQSINWAEDIARQNDCSRVFYLGDFFDKPELVSEEITALADIDWYGVPHLFLCGNHETSSYDLKFNSANTFLLNNSNSGRVIVVPDKEEIDDFEICYLPYIFESERKSICEYFGNKNKRRIILSHNDIKGFQMGQFISKDGFELDDIKTSCDIYLNGHLHNGSKICDGIINVGNLTGQNFSEDAFKYHHCVLVLDTDSLVCEVYDNPFAYNFYKVDFSTNNDIKYIDEISSKMRNAVVTMKCKEQDFNYLNKRFNPFIPEDQYIPRNCNIKEIRFIIQGKENTVKKDDIDLSIDHIEKFREYIIEKLGSSTLLEEELQEVCK